MAIVSDGVSRHTTGNNLVGLVFWGLISYWGAPQFSLSRCTPTGVVMKGVMDVQIWSRYVWYKKKRSMDVIWTYKYLCTLGKDRRELKCSMTKTKPLVKC